MKRKIVCLLLAALMLLAATGTALAANDIDRSVTGGVFKLTTVEDFNGGELEALIVDDSVGDGAVKLADGAQEGVFTSQIIGTEPFEYMVASWNADVPLGASVEISARAYVDKLEAWSDWCSWGVWQPEIKRHSTDDENELAYIDVDTFTVKGSSGETASRVQLKAVLKASEGGESPVLRQVAATYKNTLDGQAITPAFYSEEVQLPDRVRLDTPAYSQNIRERTIAGVMCSATTITVLLNDRGEDLLPEEVALADYDQVYEGFGNWSYSVAAAGAFGYDAFCQYADLNVLRQELAQGRSVGVSISFSGGALEGAPISSTNGHLVTITGYETIDGVPYFYSSDSSANNDPNCLVRFRADQLDAAWRSKVAYIVRDKEANAGVYAPKRVQAELVPLEGEENAYALTVEGERVEFNKNLPSVKLRADGGGIIAFYIEEAAKAAMPDNVKMTTANSIIRYTLMPGESSLIIDPVSALAGIEGKGTVHVFVMMNNGITYEARLELENAPASTPEPEVTQAPQETAAPAATVEPKVTAEPAAPADASASSAAPDITVWIIVAVVAVIAIAAIVIVRSKKKK